MPVGGKIAKSDGILCYKKQTEVAELCFRKKK